VHGQARSQIAQYSYRAKPRLSPKLRGNKTPFTEGERAHPIGGAYKAVLLTEARHPVSLRNPQRSARAGIRVR
jgi:hypothetical protein